MTQLHDLTIAEASRLIAARKLSPVELTRAFVTRVKALDAKLNAFILLLEESALAEAASAEAEIAAGRYRGPLHGIPIGLKDIYSTKGIATTGHSALMKDNVPAEDAHTVTLLRQAGAVILGKLATHEFATGGPSFDLPWPPARNPWDLSRMPGGSSSGSGAAVAAALCPGAMGTDTGGSIRFPAAMCGVAGHKPTYGLVSRRGIMPLAFSLDHAGPLCWTSEDCALMMNVLAGYDPLDPASADVPKPDFSRITSGIKGMTIGAIRHFHETDDPCDPEVAAAFDASVETLEALGATVKTITVSPLQHYNDIGNVILRAEAYSIHERHLTPTPMLYGALGRRRLAAGAFLRASDYVSALRHRSRLVLEMASAMAECDAVITTGWPTPAPDLSENAMVRGPMPTMVFNVTGSPALSICNGFSSSGLPLALQIAGKPFADPTVLSIGHALEQATAFRSMRPSFAAQRARAA